MGVFLYTERKNYMTVNILGTKYKIIFADKNEKPKLKEADGYMDHSIKEIVVEKFESDLMSVEDLENYSRKVLRHEIIHAFFVRERIMAEQQ